MVTSSSVPQCVLLEQSAEILYREGEQKTINFEMEWKESQGSHFDNPFGHGVTDGDVLLELYHSALYLRQLLLSMDNFLPNVPTSTDLSQDASKQIPKVVFIFFDLADLWSEWNRREPRMTKSLLLGLMTGGTLFQLYEILYMQQLQDVSGLPNISCYR